MPDKFIAFRGPKDLDGRQYVDEDDSFRHFSPVHYAPRLLALGATAVVRLNEPEYDPCDFALHDIEHLDLPFQDCTAPPAHIVAAFFQAVDRQRGLTAVHCKAGLGRTGTLIALYMMRSCGFGARAAIAWLRIVRPGSVIGEQQRYLCAVERGLSSPPRQPAPSPLPRTRSWDASSVQASPPPTSPVVSWRAAGVLPRFSASFTFGTGPPPVAAGPRTPPAEAKDRLDEPGSLPRRGLDRKSVV